MPVASYRVGFLPDLLAPIATLRSLLEVGGSTSNYAESGSEFRPSLALAP